ncbi:MAG: hypothetical protein CL910_13375 [Deltaproteobacteria bacterium]|jgi:hypothetical protein|nr:hypothetical protein [Deltaproteobacteria bacterium]
MKTEDALGEFLAANQLAKRGSGREEWYADKWFYTPILGVQVPFFPHFGFRRGLPAHDTHHMLNGYPTNWVGECETAAWELASGGCGPHIVYWVDRILFLAIALAIAPLRSLRAWRRGWSQQNLYRFDPDQLLAMDLTDVSRHIWIGSGATSDP